MFVAFNLTLCHFLPLPLLLSLFPLRSSLAFRSSFRVPHLDSGKRTKARKADFSRAISRMGSWIVAQRRGRALIESRYKLLIT